MQICCACNFKRKRQKKPTLLLLLLLLACSGAMINDHRYLNKTPNFKKQKNLAILDANEMQKQCSPWTGQVCLQMTKSLTKEHFFQRKTGKICATEKKTKNPT
jgi:hypothetical protein